MYQSQSQKPDINIEAFEKHSEWRHMDLHFEHFQDLLPFNDESEELLSQLVTPDFAEQDSEARMAVIWKMFRLFTYFKFVKESDS